MTGNEMLSTLGLRLNDPDSGKFPEAARLDALNIAQKSVVNLMSNAYLTDLQVIQTDCTVTDGAIAFSTLTSEPIRNGVVAVKAKNQGSGGGTVAINKFCTMVEPTDIKRLENTYLSGSASNPVAYIFQQKIYFEPDNMSTADVWYMKEPNALAADGTACILNVALHELVVDMAESQLWKMAGKSDQAAIAQSNAISNIAALNERYENEKPTGIGV